MRQKVSRLIHEHFQHKTATNSSEDFSIPTLGPYLKSKSPWTLEATSNSFTIFSLYTFDGY